MSFVGQVDCILRAVVCCADALRMPGRPRAAAPPMAIAALRILRRETFLRDPGTFVRWAINASFFCLRQTGMLQECDQRLYIKCMIRVNPRLPLLFDAHHGLG